MPEISHTTRSNHAGFLTSAGKALLLASLLVACAQPVTPSTTPSGTTTSVSPANARPANIATVKLLATDTPESLARRYGGDVIVFEPEGNFALVTTNFTDSTEPAETSHLSVIEPNLRVVRLINSGSVWSSGTGAAWADGTGAAWADGTGAAWADGTGAAWADGQFTPLPANTDAWKAIQLDDAQHAIPELGEGVIIAVIDSGVDTAHPALKNRLAPAKLWRDMVDNDGLPDEVGTPSDPAFGHGTAVATIAAQVSLRARILPYRVIAPDGYGNLSDVVNAVTRAKNNGAKVINLSLGTDQRSPALESVIRQAEAKGVIVVAASGNRGLAEIDYPARNASSSVFRLSVGSIDNTFARSTFSNHGTGLELYAPGEAIRAAAPGERLVAWTGTSMSTAVVSGAAALGLSTKTSASLVSQALTDTAVPLRGATSASPGVINLAAFARKLGR